MLKRGDLSSAVLYAQSELARYVTSIPPAVATAEVSSLPAAPADSGAARAVDAMDVDGIEGGRAAAAASSNGASKEATTTPSRKRRARRRRRPGSGAPASMTNDDDDDDGDANPKTANVSSSSGAGAAAAGSDDVVIMMSDEPAPLDYAMRLRDMMGLLAYQGK